MLVSLKEARAKIDRARFTPPRVRRVRARDSIGRLSAMNVRARRDIPPVDVSAMDGYAVWVSGRLGMGPFPWRGGENGLPRGQRLERNEAVRVATGSPLPPGANAVVRIEATHREGDRIRVVSPVRPGDDIHPRGESVQRGEILVRKGEPIRPYHLSALLAEQVRSIPAYDLRIGILPVGDEFVPGRARGAERVIDHIGPVVASLLPFSTSEILAPAPDDPDALRRRLRDAVRGHDLLVTVGGASVGAHDSVKRVLEGIGKVLFDGVHVNVLKRGAVASVRGRPVIILPGLVTSAITVFHEHGLHVLSRMVGTELRQYELLPLGEDVEVHHHMDSTYLFELRGGKAYPLPWGTSRGSVLIRAGAFGILSHGKAYRAGDVLSVQRLVGAR